MLSRPERRQLLALLSQGGHAVEKSCVRRVCGTILQEITIHHSWMSEEHRLEMKVSVVNGDLLFMGKLDSVFPEHEDVFFGALSDRASDDERTHAWPRLILAISNAVLPFLDSLDSVKAVKACYPDRLEGRGLVTVALREAV